MGNDYTSKFKEAGLPEVAEALNKDPAMQFTQDLAMLDSMSPEELAVAAFVKRSGRESSLRGHRARYGGKFVDSNEQWVEVYFDSFELSVLLKFFSLVGRTLSDNVHELVARKLPSDLNDPNNPFPYNAGDEHEFCSISQTARLA